MHPLILKKQPNKLIIVTYDLYKWAYKVDNSSMQVYQVDKYKIEQTRTQANMLISSDISFKQIKIALYIYGLHWIKLIYKTNDVIVVNCN